MANIIDSYNNKDNTDYIKATRKDKIIDALVVSVPYIIIVFMLNLIL